MNDYVIRGTAVMASLSTNEFQIDDMEARFRTAWCQLLYMEEDELNSDSHFFKQGGDSVAAIRLISVAEDYRIRLDDATIYDFLILKNMASSSQEIHVTSNTNPLKFHTIFRRGSYSKVCESLSNRTSSNRRYLSGH